MNEQEALDLFRRWFLEPINILKQLPNGNGGFVVFMVGLTLYERLIIAKLKLAHEETSKERVKREMATDLRLSEENQSVFWNMFRNGLLHQGMPRAGSTGFVFHDSYSEYPDFRGYNGTPIICINPWKFTDRVLTEFLSQPKLILASESFPLPSIAQLPSDLLNNTNQYSPFISIH